MSTRPNQDGHQLSVWLPDDAHARVAEIARDESISMAAVVRRATIRELRRVEHDERDRVPS